MDYKFICTVKQGRLIFDRPRTRDAYISGLPDDTVLEEVLAKPKTDKTLAQLAYIHGVVFKLASEASGYTPIEVKDLLKKQFLTYYITSKKTMKPIEVMRSLADLKTSEMIEFIDQCIIAIAENWHCVIPSPDEVKC